jgi:hypothetical protein
LSKILVNVYLCGWLVTTIGAFTAANKVPDRRRPQLLTQLWIAVLAGALWPILVVGVIQVIAIAVLARSNRTASVSHADQAPMTRDEELAFPTDLSIPHQLRASAVDPHPMPAIY